MNNKLTPTAKTAIKITNGDGVAAAYEGTYDGSSVLSTSSSEILMMYRDEGTYYDVICMANGQSWTPGSSYLGYRLYRSSKISGGFSNRFTLLDGDDVSLLDLGDASHTGVADAHLWIHKTMLILDLPVS